MQYPLIDIMIRTLTVECKSHNDEGLLIKYDRYVIGFFGLFLFIILKCFSQRLFQVNVPSENIPWSGTIVSKVIFIHMGFSIVLILCIDLNITKNLAFLEVGVLFIWQSFLVIYRIIFLSVFDIHVGQVVKVKDLAVWLLLLNGLICKLISDRLDYDLLYFALLIAPCFYIVRKIGSNRDTSILYKVKNRRLKLHSDHEYALYLIIKAAEEVIVFDPHSEYQQTKIGEIISLLESHISNCNETDCKCNDLETYYDLEKLGKLFNKESFVMIGSQYRKYQSLVAGDDNNRQTYSTFTDIIGKQSNNSNELNEKSQDVADSREEINYTENNHEVHKKRTLFKVDMVTSKRKFLCDLLHLISLDIQRKFPYSPNLFFLFLHFVLHYRQNEILCIFLLQSFPRYANVVSNHVQKSSSMAISVEQMSYLEQCSFYINELHMLREIEKSQRESQRSHMHGDYGRKFDGEYFININHLYSRFHDSVETQIQKVLNFWECFLKQEFEVESVLKLSMAIALNTRELNDVFTSLDSNKLSKDHLLYFKYAMVQLHIMNDPVQYENYMSKMKSIIDVHSIFHKSNNQGVEKQVDIDNCNFIIVDANGERFGKIILMNTPFRHILGHSQEYVTNMMHIEHLMPELIQHKHHAFINKFHSTGKTSIINNRMSVFIKKSNGFIFPSELFVKFHYSQTYQYTFVAIIKPHLRLSPFIDGVTYNLDQLHFLIVDNDKEGMVKEMSESWLSLLDSQEVNYDQSQLLNISLRIGDLIEKFNYSVFKKGRQIREMAKERYQNNHKIDLRVFKDDNNMQSVAYQRRKGVCISDHFQSIIKANKGMLKVKVRVFEEKYCGGLQYMNIFCLTLLEEQIDEEGDQSRKSLGQNSLHKNLFASFHISQDGGSTNAFKRQVTIITSKVMKSPIKKKKTQITEGPNSRSEGDKTKDHTHSVTGSSNSTTSTYMAAQFRSQELSLTNRKTPKLVAIIMRLVLGLYLAMVIVATVNMVITRDRQQESEFDIKDVKDSYDRMNQISMNQLIMRVLANIANGYEPDQNQQYSLRFQKYIQLQTEKIQQLQIDQNQLLKSRFDKSEAFMQFENGQNTELEYLNEYSQVIQQKENFNVAMKLLISKLIALNQATMDQLKGYIALFNQKAAVEGYRPNNFEKDAYFVLQNGIKSIRRSIIDVCDFYSREAEEHAQASIKTIMITAILSIISIIIIGCIIAPMLTKSEARKYQSLSFFLQIPASKLQLLCQNCRYCLNMTTQHRFDQILRDYECLLGIRITLQNLEEEILLKSQCQKSPIKEQEGGGGGQFAKGDLVMSYAMQIASQGGEFSMNEKSVDPTTEKVSSPNLQVEDDQCLSESRSSSDKRSSFKKIQSSHASSSIDGASEREDNIALDISNGKQNVNTPKQQQEPESAQVLTLKSMFDPKDIQKDKKKASVVVQASKFANRLKTEIMMAKKLQQQQQIVEEPQEVGTQGQSSTPSSDFKNDSSNFYEEQSNDSKKLTIKNLNLKDLNNSEDVDDAEQQRLMKCRLAISKSYYKKRLSIILVLLSIISALTSYFLIAYFLSIRTFQTSSDVIKSLEVIFYKGACFDQTISFLREDQIRNEVMTARDPRIRLYGDQDQSKLQFLPASDLYLNFCQEEENLYQALRTNLPKYLKGAERLIKILESPHICDENFNSTTQPQMYTLCNSSLDGVLVKGLSNAFSYMFSQVLKANLHLKAIRQNKEDEQVEAALREEIRDETLIEIIDTKAIVLDSILTKLKLACMASVIDYTASLLNDYMVCFIVFLSSLTVGMLILQLMGFTRMKKTMLDTNLVIRIIPFETLPKVNRQEIKDFINS